MNWLKLMALSCNLILNICLQNGNDLDVCSRSRNFLIIMYQKKITSFLLRSSIIWWDEEALQPNKGKHEFQSEIICIGISPLPLSGYVIWDRSEYLFRRVSFSSIVTLLFLNMFKQRDLRFRLTVDSTYFVADTIHKLVCMKKILGTMPGMEWQLIQLSNSSSSEYVYQEVSYIYCYYKALGTFYS